jgi:hypothetical protein
MKTKEEKAAYQRAWRQANAEKVKASKKASKARSSWKEDPLKVKARNSLRDPVRLRALNAERRKVVTKEVMAEYGGKCVCCGEANLGFLTIDHVYGNGTQHRKEIFGDRKAGIHMYRWLKKQGFPKEGYQVMCFNCNLGRQRNGGSCPHVQ